MNVQIEHISDTKVKLTIAVAKDALQDAEKVALHKLAKKVSVPGFRKGKVPASVAKKHVNPAELAQETVDNALSKAVAEAFMSNELRALERPAVEVTKFVPEQELEFTAEAEVIPKITLGDYKKLKAPKKANLDVKKEEVDEIIDRILTQMAEKKTVERAAKMGDEVVIDFVGKKDGVAFDGGTANGHAITLGSGTFIPGFEEAVVDHKAGDEFDVEVSFPEDYRVKELAGAPVVFSTKLHEVKEAIKPELTDEIAKKAGEYKTAAELTADIERELGAQKEREHNEQVRDDLVKQLVEKSTVPVPAILLDDQLKSIEQDMTQNLMYQGATLDGWLESKGYKNKDEWIEKEARDAASMRVKAGLVLSELAKALNVTATNEDVEAQATQLKAQYANNPDMAKRFDEPEVRRDIANRLLTEKAIEQLVELTVKK